MNLVANFFEWGLDCKDLSTTSEQVPGVEAIASFSFKWTTITPELSAHFNSKNIGRTYGVGQYNFEMFPSDNKSIIQDAFKKQTILSEVNFIKYINQEGKPLESERYIIKNAIIVNYSFESKPDQIGQRYSLMICGNGEEQFKEKIRDIDGTLKGSVVTSPYNVAKGVL
jgi:hypothetical protein